MKSSTLHIIPITSKKHTKNIEIGTILYSKKEIINLKNILKQTEDAKEIKKINSVIKYYENRKIKLHMLV